MQEKIWIWVDWGWGESASKETGKRNQDIFHETKIFSIKLEYTQSVHKEDNHCPIDKNVKQAKCQ